MTVRLVPMTEKDFAAAESRDAEFVRARFAYGLHPEAIVRELERRGRRPTDALHAVNAVRRDRERRI